MLMICSKNENRGFYCVKKKKLSKRVNCLSVQLGNKKSPPSFQGGL